jgi:hypothetical protein
MLNNFKILRYNPNNELTYNVLKLQGLFIREVHFWEINISRMELHSFQSPA